MKDHLKLIEKYLQNFFEHQLQNLGGKDVFTEITESIIETMRNRISLREGKEYAPNIYRISTNFKKPISEVDQETYTETLKTIIRDICQEDGLSLSGPIHIQFFNHPKLKDNFIIEVSFSTPAGQETARIMAGEKESKKMPEKIPGYLITSSDEIFEINNKIINIGRQEDNELVVDNLLVSRLHAQIRTLNGKHVLFDIDSIAGTKVNGKRIRQQPLSPGDVIEIADISLIYYRELDEDHLNDSKNITKKIS